MNFTEETLKSYAAPLSATENGKCKHAIEAIRDALKNIGYTDGNREIVLLESDTLSYSLSMQKRASSERIHLFIQGSYANNTCVRQESDVDIAVVREDLSESAFGEDFHSALVTKEKVQEAKYLKDTVESILNQEFPYQVRRGNKSIKVKGNTYRKDADTVPCLSMKYYYRSHLKDYSSQYEGIIIYADDGSTVRNFPKQHIANGKAKNSRTNHYYKKMVRIMKKMRYLMERNGYSCATKVSSFGLESLLWNIPDYYFTKYHLLGYAFEEIISYLYHHKSEIHQYYEANGIKKLCRNQDDINNYAVFIDWLHVFYNYCV